MLWLTGPVGVGKSTTAWQAHQRLLADGVPNGYVDLDQIGMRYPAPPDDPANHRVKADSLAAVLPGYLASGARCLVVSGNAPDQPTVDRYLAVLTSCEVTVVRLRVPEDELRRRIVGRGTFLEVLDALLEEARALEARPPRSLAVDVADLTPQDAAARVLAESGFAAGAGA